MLKQYETVFIMTPVLSDEQMKETVGKFKAMLTENGAKLVHEENWGLRKLAYPIQKKTTGFYHLLEYQAGGDLVAKLEVAFKRDERVIRYMTVSLDKHAIAYNIKRRNKAGESAQTKAELSTEA